MAHAEKNLRENIKDIMRRDKVGAPILNAYWLHTAEAVESTSAELKQLGVIGSATFRVHDQGFSLILLDLSLLFNNVIDNLFSFLFGTCSVKENGLVSRISHQCADHNPVLDADL